MALFVIFVIFTYMVKNYHTAPVGFEGAVIGFSRLNIRVHDAFPGDSGCFKASETLGYICLLLAGVNAIIALADFIKHRGLRNMHRRNIITMCYYAVVVFFYGLFEFFVINLRPIEAEASYPSPSSTPIFRPNISQRLRIIRTASQARSKSCCSAKKSRLPFRSRPT